jgi:signal transduction histidine kinase
MLLARARPWLADHQPILVRAIGPVLGVGMAWWLSAVGVTDVLWVGLAAYAAVQLILIAAAQSRPRVITTPNHSISWMAIIADVLLSLLLLSQAESLGTAVFPVYILIALRVLASYQRSPFGTVTPFLLGPTYLFAMYLGNQEPPLTLMQEVGSWVLLLGSLGFGTVAIWISASQARQNVHLRSQLRAERQNREARVEELERITNELRARMRERHALEEGLRVITSTLSLDEVLTQIVDTSVQTFGQERIHALALSLEIDDEMKHHTFALDGRAPARWAEPITRRVMAQDVPLIAADAGLDDEMQTLAAHGMRSVLSVPLFVGDGPARGALTVVSATFAAFSSSDARYLGAFASQAGIAIANAELHSRLHRQQRLLESVMRDINDGLVVVDGADEIVLANPLGQRLLDGTSAEQPVWERLLELVDSVQADGNSSAAAELKVAEQGEEETTERYYQAFASQVRREDSDEPLTAIVLHDITDQKAEEKARVEFISMVSHELRNPIHSLNGFVKVVLQGRAGTLTELQQDFLQMADAQIEQLKGRIAELLEFNRLKAGRLSLNPQWSDLSLLITGTLNRLSLQAEERGLALVNGVTRHIPETWCDSARIGQVLTNLVENAIKATPPGGTITVSGEIHEQEVWVRVRDTGVGIPASDLGKIFQRFYRVAKHTNGPDNHLGLGLAICQQIVEGHGGRMWVESEEGVGTCFTFALPTIPRERSVGN